MQDTKLVPYWQTRVLHNLPINSTFNQQMTGCNLQLLSFQPHSNCSKFAPYVTISARFLFEGFHWGESQGQCRLFYITPIVCYISQWRIVVICWLMTSFDTLAHGVKVTQEWLSEHCPVPRLHWQGLMAAKQPRPEPHLDLNPIEYCLCGTRLGELNELNANLENVAKLNVTLQVILNDLSDVTLCKSVLTFCNRFTEFINAQGGHF